MPRSMAPEIATTHNGVCVPASRASREKRPCHRARGEACRHQQDRRQAQGDPDCPVRYGTHDGRVAHSAHLRKLHSASLHLRLDGCDLTEYIMKWFSLHPRGRLLRISQRNSASWHGLRHSAHDCCNSQGEDQRAHRQHLHCWRQTPPFWPLPAFLLRHIWLCQLDSDLYAVAVRSFVFHGLWLGASAVVNSILEPHDRQIRGWARLMSVGAMNSVLYSLLLRHPGFGEHPTWARPRWVLRHPLSRVGLHCHDLLGTTSCDVRGFSSCCTRFDTWARHQMVESAPAVAYGAPGMTHFPPPPVAPAVTNMGDAAPVAPAPAVTYRAPPVVPSSGPYAVTYSPQPQVAPAVTYMGAAPVAPAPFFLNVLDRTASFTCRDLHE